MWWSIESSVLDVYMLPTLGGQSKHTTIQYLQYNYNSQYKQSFAFLVPHQENSSQESEDGFCYKLWVIYKILDDFQFDLNINNTRN